jgi:subtilisin family serine protease
VWLLVGLFPIHSAHAYHTGATTGVSQVDGTGLIVKFTDDISFKKESHGRTAVTTGLAVVDRLNDKYAVRDSRPFVHMTNRTERDHPFRNVVVLTVPDGTDLAAMRDEYAALPNVAYAEIDRPYELFTADSLYGQQWHLHNTGQAHYSVVRYEGDNNDSLVTDSGTPGADIQADSALSTPPSNSDTVVVAIIDSGVDMDHPELADRIWINYAEYQYNGKDSDHNGYIDDRYGYDFSASDTIIYAEDADPTDYLGHGTHVAGIVAAEADNSIGVAGITPVNVVIMPLKVFPLAVTSKIAQAIVYAADNEADVINMSLGSPFPSTALAETMAYAKKKGLVICAATGNSGDNSEFYPASDTSAIAIGASNHDDEVTYFSTYGTQVDLIAPGQDVLSLRADSTDMYAPNEAGLRIIDDIYYLADGTSMASPMVAGVAAYLRAISSGLDPDAVQDILEQTAQDILDPYSEGDTLTGWDEYSGWGRVDLQAAMAEVPEINASLQFPKENSVLGAFVIFTGFADGTDFTNYTIEYGMGKLPTSWTTLVTSNTPVSNNGFLGAWSPSGVEGTVTFRLQVGEDNWDMQTVWFAPNVLGEITVPADSDTVVMEIVVEGSAGYSYFGRYDLEYREVGDTGAWTLITSSSVPRFNDTLGVWETHELASGWYDLRVITYFMTDSLLGGDTSRVFVEPTPGANDWVVNLGASPTIFPIYCDFDNDGENEIIVGTTTGVRYFDDGGNEITSGVPAFPAGAYRVPMSVGNFDGDGVNDFVCIEGIHDTLYGYRSTGGIFKTYVGNVGHFENPSFVGGDNSFPFMICVDADNDGIDEILLCNGTSVSKIQVGDAAVYQAWGGGGGGVVAADLNLDDTTEVYYNYGRTIRRQRWTGSVEASTVLVRSGDTLLLNGMAAVDIDADNELELIVNGTFQDLDSSFVYALEYDLSVVSGWPHNLYVDPFLIPLVPVFGDIDNDGELEYVTTYYDLDHSYLHAFNIDGSFYKSGTPLLATAPQPSIINFLTLTDIDDDGHIDIVAQAHTDIFFSNPGEWLYGWDADGNMHADFPKTLVPDAISFDRFTPVIGDIDQDTYLDMVMLSSDNKLHFMEFGSNPFHDCKSPITAWRYHQNRDATGPSFVGDCSEYICGDADYNLRVDSFDVVYIVDYIFSGGPEPVPYEAGDVNCETGVDISDALYLINYVFHDGTAPCECDSGMMFALRSDETVTVEAVTEDGTTTLTITSPIELSGFLLTFEAGKQVTAELASSQNGSLRVGHQARKMRVGMMEVTGSPVLRANQPLTIRIDGECKFLSGQAIDSDGRRPTVAYASTSGDPNLPKEFALYQNHPNPFNPTTMIRFDLPKASHVRIEIFNLLGQRVTRLVDGVMDAGRQAVEWDATGKASGVYFYKITAEDFVSSKKMVLLK